MIRSEHMKKFPVYGGVSFLLKKPTFMGNDEWWSAEDSERAEAPGRFAAVSELPYCIGASRASTARWRPKAR